MSPRPGPLFTVFTPTFNRAHTLGRVHRSLQDQTFRDFEWLVVDDGSTDGTGELVAGWQRTADVPIRYLRQENRGKHHATNRGVREAQGELFLVLDSDDRCVPTALERFAHHWFAIPDEARSGFTAVTARCMDPAGRPFGDAFPSPVLDSDSLELYYRHRIQGEKWGFHRTVVLRRHPFPEDLEREYLPESVVWHRIARDWKTRFVDEPLRIYHVEGLSMVHAVSPAHNAAGGRAQHRLALEEHLDWFLVAPGEFLRSAIHYVRFSLHLGLSPVRLVRELRGTPGRLLVLAALPPGMLVYWKDRLRYR